MTDHINRRNFLRATAGSMAVAAIAGCSSDDGDGGSSGGDETTDGMEDGMDEETDGMNEEMTGTDSMSEGGMDGETDSMDEETDSMTEDEMMSMATFEVTITNVSEAGTITTSEGDDVAVPLSPTAYAVHTADATAFESGGSANEGLESLAEDGSPDAFAAEVEMADGVDHAGTVATPDGAEEHGPLMPGDSYTFEVEAGHDHNLTLATMFVQSNDLFYAPEPSGISLFEDGDPLSGDVTDELVLWDAGTEQNQEPGVGADQAPRQDGTDTGPEEMANVRPIENVMDEYEYPDTSEVVEVTVTTM